MSTKKLVPVLVVAAVVFGLLLLGSGALQPAPTELVVHAYENFKITPALQQSFEREHNIKLKIVTFASSDLMLEQAITRKGEQGDVLYGVDNLNMLQALKADLFEPYRPPQLSAMPAHLRLDPTNRLQPVEVNYITINYDKKWFETKLIPPPKGLRALRDEQRLVHRFTMPQPDKSPIGFAFLAATVGAFPENSAYPWQQFWRDYTPRILHFTQTWNEAYSTQFSANTTSPEAHPLCVSFSAAPAAEATFKQIPEPRIGNLEDIAFEQPRFVGIHKTSSAKQAAQMFVDFVMSADFQQSIPLQMWSYPALPNTTLPDIFVKFAPPPANPIRLPPEQLAQNRERWTKEWLKLMGMEQ
jgi:thiamine transport system substrate-binding protein